MSLPQWSIGLPNPFVPLGNYISVQICMFIYTELCLMEHTLVLKNSCFQFQVNEAINKGQITESDVYVIYC